MSSQIFKKAVPQHLFMDFIKKYADHKKNYYAFSKTAFKKAQLEKAIEPFCQSLSEYYYLSKRFYVTRPMNYRNIITIIRQLCKYYHIPFTSTIQYNKSKYEIMYSIYFDISS